jgi:ATP-dependent Lon protease
LAYSGSGNGGIMPIEASYMPGNGRLKLTGKYKYIQVICVVLLIYEIPAGSLGEVIKESAELAVSWVKSNAFALKLTSSPKQDVFKDIDLHIHLPGGAVPKDGPSAGITMVICLISLLSGECVLRSTAMTGEVTLRGQVRPVGGIKEKVISAHRAGVKKVLLPAVNRRDVQNDIPKSIQDQMTFVYCRSIWDAVHAVFESTSVRFEPRLTSSL